MDSLSLSLSYEGRPVRMVGTPEAPEWVATDVCAVLGLSAVGRACARIPAGEKGVLLAHTPGGQQQLVTVKLSGLLRLILRSDKPEAQRFQTWTVTEVLPCVLKHGCYPAPEVPVLVEEHLVAQAQALLAFRRDLEAVKRDVAQIKADRADAEQAALALPEPAVVAPDKPLRSSLNEVVRIEAQRRGGEYQSTWRDLYRELRYRCHFDAPVRAKLNATAALDEVEGAGLLPQLYAIACDIFRPRKAA